MKLLFNVLNNKHAAHSPLYVMMFLDVVVRDLKPFAHFAKLSYETQITPFREHR